MKSRPASRSLPRRRPLSAELLEARRVLAYSDAVLSDGPVAYWRMNETSGTALVDSSPIGGLQNGTYNGNPMLGQPATFAEPGTSVRFDPADSADWARAANVPIGESFTYEIWAKSATSTWNINGWLGVDRGANGFIVHPSAGGTVWTGYIVDAGGTFHSIVSHTAPNITDWHHYAITFDGATNTGSMYFDGQLVGSKANIAATRTAGTVNIDLGSDDRDVYNGTNSRPGNGWLDEAALYDKALTPAQIQAHYQARTDPTINVAWDGEAFDFQWDNPINWVGDSNIPDQPNERAVFRDTNVGTVDLSGGHYNIDRIVFSNDTGSYNIMGAGSIATGGIQQTGSASNTIDVGLTLSGAGIEVADATSTLTIESNVQLPATQLTVDGAGSVVINGNLGGLVAGRFLRVQNDGTASRLLHISEIEAYAPGVTPNPNAIDNTNDFANTTAGASFESFTGPFGHGTLGNSSPLNGAGEGGSPTWTLNNGVGNNYVADLGQDRTIGLVRVWQRNDSCCQERLSDFSVEILADNGSGAPGAVVARRSFVGIAPTNAYASLNFVSSAKLIKRGSGTLTLAGDNNYSGGTEIHEGELRIANTTGSATGSGPVQVGPSAANARFINVTNLGASDRLLHIGEIEAFGIGVTPAAGIDPGDNLAHVSNGGTIESTSGTGGHGIAQAVINGVVDGGAATWTRGGVGVQMTVDLGRNQDLSQVRVWQRSDCCFERLENIAFNLHADDGFGGVGPLLHTASLTGRVPNSSFTSFAIPAAATPSSTGRLTGSGSIAGAVTVLAGSTFAPGVGATGTGTLHTGGLTFALNALTEAHVSPTGADAAVVDGDVRVAGALPTLTIATGYRPPHQEGIVLIDNQGPNPVVGIFAALPDGTPLTLSGRQYELSYDYDAATGVDETGNDVAIIPIDRAPTASITSPPRTIAEGGADISLAASGSDADGDPLTFTWDLNGDGTFGDATGANITVSWAQLVAAGVNDGTATYNVQVRASDGELTGDSATQTLTVTNTAPTAFVTGPASAISNQELEFDFSATDPSPADTAITYVIDWGDGETTEEPGLAAGVTLSHAYTDFGLQTITVQARDKDGGLSAPVTHLVDIVPAAVDAEGNLNVSGSGSSDRIILSFSGGVQVRLNNRMIGKFSSVEKVVVFGGGGNDTITFASNIPVPAEIYGGDGNDYLTGGGKADLLDGGPGNDRLIGGGGDDELLGGEGNDNLSGGLANDTLDGGDGNDTVNGQGGSDTIIGGLGNDRLNGGTGNDIIHGGEGRDTLDGAAGADILVGGLDSDKLYGRDGRDLLLGGQAADTLYGGTGDDLLLSDETASDEIVEDLVDALSILLSEGSDGDFSLYFNDASIFPITPDTVYGEGGSDRFLGANGDLVRDKRSIDLLELFDL